MEVDGDDVYYRRAIVDGDLLILSNDAPSAAEQSNQQPENGLAGLGESQNAKKGK